MVGDQSMASQQEVDGTTCTNQKPDINAASVQRNIIDAQHGLCVSSATQVSACKCEAGYQAIQALTLNSPSFVCFYDSDTSQRR